jgi:hypothetical protein
VNTIAWYRNPKSLALVAATGLAAFGIGLVVFLLAVPESFMIRVATFLGMM